MRKRFFEVGKHCAEVPRKSDVREYCTMTRRISLAWGDLAMHEPSRDEIDRHAEELSRAYNDPKNAALLGHVAEIDPDGVVEHYVDLVGEGGHPVMLFLDGTLAGDGDLRGVTNGAAELAFLIAAPNAQGKGLGTRFALMLAYAGFRVLDLERVYASVAPQNVASIRVFEKLGFWIVDDPEARSFADEPEDVVFLIDRAAFDRLHGETVALWEPTR